MISSRRLSQPLQLLSLPALALTLLGCPGNSSQQTQEPGPTASPAQPAAPLVKRRLAADWCGEHGVPESICSRCNASAAADLKARGDWCNEHDVADSQCFVCNPKLEQELLKKKPASVGGEGGGHSEGAGHDH